MNPFLVSVPAAVIATGGVAAYGAIYPRAQLFGPTVCHTNSPRKLAITFDDGPNPAMTPKLLGLLDRFQAKATFFLIGRFVKQCPDLVRHIVARGHAIGNHTDTHPNLFWVTPSRLAAELRACHETMADTVGTPPKWFRPPYGYRNPWVIPAAAALGYRTAMWTLIPGDWRPRSTEWLIDRMAPIARRAKQTQSVMVEEEADPSASSRGGPGDEGRDDKWGVVAGGKSGDILCLHDGWHRQVNADRTRTLAALEHWLPRWRDLGLQFVTIDEAVRIPAP